MRCWANNDGPLAGTAVEEAVTQCQCSGTQQRQDRLLRAGAKCNRGASHRIAALQGTWPSYRKPCLQAGADPTYRTSARMSSPAFRLPCVTRAMTIGAIVRWRLLACSCRLARRAQLDTMSEKATKHSSRQAQRSCRRYYSTIPRRHTDISWLLTMGCFLSQARTGRRVCSGLNGCTALLSVYLINVLHEGWAACLE